MATISFDDLVALVEDSAADGTALARLAAASTIGAALTDHADALLTHFVDRCRDDGRTWSEIGTALGVSKQAAQKRFVESHLQRLTARTRKVLDAAREIADDQGAAALRLDHLLLALFHEPDTIAARVLTELGVTAEALEDATVRHTTARGARLSESPPPDQAVLASALDLGHNYIGTEHILLACLRDPGCVTARALADVGVGEADARDAVLAALAAR